MSNPAPPTLNYASRDSVRPRVGKFVVWLLIFGVLGFIANTGFIYLSVHSVLDSRWVYHDLMQNRKAFGREIDDSVIATLRRPLSLWLSQLAFIAACAWGLYLALGLAVSAVMVARGDERGEPRLRAYAKWKIFGAILTAVTLYWSSVQQLYFWVAATRHWPLGAGPPYVETVVLFVCAMIPARYVSRRLVA